MVERNEALEAAAKKSWRSRRQVKRLFLGWFIVSLFFAEAGASWFGIFMARHAPMSMADAKLIGERTAMAVLLVSFVVMLVAVVLQFKARQRLRQIEGPGYNAWDRLLPYRITRGTPAGRCNHPD
jgi:hypothetical protein